MTARTHDAFAFASLVTVSVFFPPESLNLATLAISIIGADIGSLIPDMDGAGNRLWDLLPAGDNLGKILRRLFYKHRTLTHSIIGILGIYKTLEWVLFKYLNSSFVDPGIILVSIMVGYVSHILSDSLTEEGVPLLFPLKFNFGFPPIKKIRIKTGKWFENIVVYPAIWVYLVWFIQRNQDKLISILKLIKV